MKLFSYSVTAKPKPCIRIREYNPKNQRVHLKLAVNGVSKSMKEHIPMANLDLQEGDFGDAGLFVENRDFYLGGKSIFVSFFYIIFEIKVLLMVSVVIIC
mgnify:FL=1